MIRANRRIMNPTILRLAAILDFLYALCRDILSVVLVPSIKHSILVDANAVKIPIIAIIRIVRTSNPILMVEGEIAAVLSPSVSPASTIYRMIARMTKKIPTTLIPIAHARYVCTRFKLESE